MNTTQETENLSAEMIAQWTPRIAAQDGKQRLARFVCSLVLGREFGESAEAYFQRRGFTAFIAWAQEARK